MAVAALDSNLALTPAQKAQLQAAIEAQLAEITKLMGSDGGDSHEVLAKLAQLGLPALEAALAASLNPEQKTALETYKGKERARQADTKRSKNSPSSKASSTSRKANAMRSTASSPTPPRTLSPRPMPPVPPTLVRPSPASAAWTWTPTTSAASNS
jgi:hypothetical protein